MSPSDHSAGPFPNSATGWDAMPPKRQRFYLWVVLWWLLGGFIGILLQLLGVHYFLASLIVLALAALHLVPLGRAALDELRQRRASGAEPLKPVTPGALVGWTVAAVLFWVLVAVLAMTSDQMFVPLLPILVTVIAVVRFRQWRAQRASAENRGSSTRREKEGLR